MNLVIL